MDTHHVDIDFAAGGQRPSKLAGILPVILCGGSGTRLWPGSREGLPKQFWPLLSDRTMLQDTALRAAGELPDGSMFAAPLVVCNREHRFLIAGQLADAGVANPRIVLEPAGRNSGPAVAMAALIAAQDDPDRVLWIMPADAMIADTDALHRTLAIAVQAALTRLGDPYVWAAAGPHAFDCSGLVVWSFEQAGVSLPHSSQQLAAGGRPVALDQMRPGDVITYYASASHVGLYVGGGKMVHASTEGVPVAVVPIDNAPIYNVRRYG